ncbi:hypothetical protein ACWENR_10425 [Micromonospora sp. NPDC004336]
MEAVTPEDAQGDHAAPRILWMATSNFFNNIIEDPAGTTWN